MKSPAPEKLRPLLRVVAAREMACRADVQHLLGEERALRAEIAQLADGRPPQASLADLRAAERWHVWAMRHQAVLQQRLAAVLGRKAAAMTVLGQAMAKRQAVERLWDAAMRHRRKTIETRQNDSVLATEILAAQERRRHNS